MANNIFDIDGPPIDPPAPEPRKRSKQRESLTPSETLHIKRRLVDAVNLAIDTLVEAAELADYGNSIRAATALLDRAGYGPKSTVDVNTVNVDLSNLTREELAERAGRIAGILRASAEKSKAVAPTIN